MKKFIVIILVFFSLYGITYLFFPFSPYLLKPEISYTSTEKHVEEYTQLYHSLDNAGNSTFRSIVYTTGQGWAMEREKVNISMKELFIIKSYLTDTTRKLENLQRNPQSDFIIHNIEKNLEAAIDNIEIVATNQWSSRKQIENVLTNIRNETYKALENLKEYSLVN